MIRLTTISFAFLVPVMLPSMLRADEPTPRNVAPPQREHDRIVIRNNGTIRASYDFNDEKQFAAWKVGPEDRKKQGKWDFGDREVNWTWQQDKRHVRGNGGYLLWPHRLSAHRPVTIEFIAGKDNGNIHCGLFTGEPRFTAKGGGFYFNAGGCSKSFTSLAQNGRWFAERKLPFEKGLYPIRLTYTPDVDAKTVKITYTVNGKVYFDESRPIPDRADQGFTFAFLSGWAGGGYSIDRVTIDATPFDKKALDRLGKRMGRTPAIK